MPTLYLIRGVPGSGKSSLAQELKGAGLVEEVLEANDYFTDLDGNYEFRQDRLHMAHAYSQGGCKGVLKSGKSVAVSNTSTTEKEVETYRKIAEQCGAKFISLIVENRHEGKNIHGVPEEKIQQMKDRFTIKL